MFIHDVSGELNVKLVYLGGNADHCVQHLLHIHRALAPGLASPLTRLAGDGQHLSRETELVFFDFAPVTRNSDDRSRLRLHLYAIASSPSRVDLEFLLLGVDVLLFVRGVDPETDQGLLEMALEVMGELPAVGFELCDESPASSGPSSHTSLQWPVLSVRIASGEGVIEALQHATKALLERARSAG